MGPENIDMDEIYSALHNSKPMLTNAMAAIKEFHYDKGVSPRCEMPMTQYTEDSSRRLTTGVEQFIQQIVDFAGRLEPYIDDDPRILRIHLILEEVAETCKAMLEGDVVETLDGLADSIYVIVGTAVQFGLPLDLAFDEVHASNMSKAPRIGSRLRDKGDTYVPPNIRACLSGTPYQVQEEKWEVDFDFHEWAAKTYPNIVQQLGSRFLVKTNGHDRMCESYTPGPIFVNGGLESAQTVVAEMFEKYGNVLRSTSRA